MNMLTLTKKITRNLLMSLGYELKRIPNEHYYHVNVWLDQKELLVDTECPVIFDVGANVGQTASQYREIFNKAKIYCFEPFEDAYSELCQTIENHENIQAYKLAVSDFSGAKKFFFNSFNPTNSLLPIANECKNYVKSEWATSLGFTDVRSVTLDEFCTKENIQKINLLKMDIQGGELMALKGSKNLLENRQIDLIYTEVLAVDLYENQPFLWDLREFLLEYDYILYGLYNIGYATAPKNSGVWTWADAIFLSPELVKKIRLNDPAWGVSV